MILAGKKTQTSRNRIESELKIGMDFTAICKMVPFARCIVESVEQRTLGSFTKEDYQREGGYALGEFKIIWRKVAGETWLPNKVVFVIRFKVKEKIESDP
jgi:hypothetical protein